MPPPRLSFTTTPPVIRRHPPKTWPSRSGSVRSATSSGSSCSITSSLVVTERTAPWPTTGTCSERRRADVKRVALYCRVSTGDQTCENQLRDLRDYCRARGFERVTEFVDQGISGTKERRP